MIRVGECIQAGEGAGDGKVAVGEGEVAGVVVADVELGVILQGDIAVLDAPGGGPGGGGTVEDEGLARADGVEVG